MAAVATPHLRQQLLDVTAELLVTDGVEALSLREIARRAGVSHGAPLRHFPSLIALLSAVGAEGFRRLYAAVDAGVAGSGPRAGPLARLAGAARGYAAFALANPGHYTLMFRPDLLDREAEDFVAAGQAAFGQLVELIEAAQATGWQPKADSRRLAAGLWASVHGVTSLWVDGAIQRPSGASAIEEILDPLLALLLGNDHHATRPRRDRR